jgi:hypothetical protein
LPSLSERAILIAQSRLSLALRRTRSYSPATAAKPNNMAIKGTFFAVNR